MTPHSLPILATRIVPERLTSKHLPRSIPTRLLLSIWLWARELGRCEDRRGVPPAELNSAGTRRRMVVITPRPSKVPLGLDLDPATAPTVRGLAPTLLQVPRLSSTVTKRTFHTSASCRISSKYISTLLQFVLVISLHLLDLENFGRLRCNALLRTFDKGQRICDAHLDWKNRGLTLREPTMFPNSPSPRRRPQRDWRWPPGIV